MNSFEIQALWPSLGLLLIWLLFCTSVYLGLIQTCTMQKNKQKKKTHSLIKHNVFLFFTLFTPNKITINGPKV